MNSNNPREQRAYKRRLKRLRAQDRRWGGRFQDTHDPYPDSEQAVDYDYDDHRSRRRLERQQEIDDGGLDS